MKAQEIFRPEYIEVPGARLRVARFVPEGGVRNLCVLLTGQTEYIEKYFEVIDELMARGFAVAALDWRGQGGSTRPLPDPLKGHLSDYREHDRDLEALMEKIVAPMAAQYGAGAPLCLAHSMGAHILIRYLHGAPESFSACVMSAPMIAISTRGIPEFFFRALAATMHAWDPTGWIWGAKGRDPLTIAFTSQIVTHDRARFERSRAYLSAHPDLRLAGPTWGWLAATERSMEEIRVPGYAEAITTPSLVCGAGADQVVLCSATRKFAARMRHGEYIEIPGAGHEILMETDAVRAQFWAAFDAFIDARGKDR